MIKGTVIHGDGYGRKLGFPTVNLKIEVIELPEDGVYAGTSILEGKEYKAGIVIGPNRKVEAHLIGFDGDAYGKEVVLTITKFLRPYMHFNSEEELITQIKKDINQC